MGIKDGGEPIDIREEAGDITEQRAKYRTGGKGIEIAAVSDKLIANERNDEDFKIMLCLFLLRTLLYPTSASYINSMYLHARKDVQFIEKKNWVTWCFNFLWEGIGKYKDQQVKLDSGCVVFLEVGLKNLRCHNYLIVIKIQHVIKIQRHCSHTPFWIFIILSLYQIYI